jgi:integrase
MPRKANGRSSIYQDANGVWHGWVTVGVKADGKPDRRHRRGRTQTEVTKKVEALEKQRAEGVVADTGKIPTVAEWIQTWLSDIAPQTASESTIESVYRPRLEIWVIPRIGRHRLDRLKADHLDALYVELAKSGLASKSVLMVHQQVSRCLKMAVRRRIIGINVATLIDAPKHRDAEIEALAQEEAKAILRESTQRRNGARWSVAFALGYRQSEALGMRWSYLDLEKRRIRVWQLKRRRFAHGCENPRECIKDRHKEGCSAQCTNHARYCPHRHGGDWVFRPPKGGKTRWSVLPEELIPQLRAQKAAQAAERLAAGDRWEDWDLVFAGPTGKPIHPSKDWAEFKEMLAAAGLRNARPHDARHTAATLLLEQGVDIRVVQEILGHSSLAVTKRYTHVTSKLAEEAAAKMGKALWT